MTSLSVKLQNGLRAPEASDRPQRTVALRRCLGRAPGCSQWSLPGPVASLACLSCPRSRQHAQCLSQAWLLWTLSLRASQGRSTFPSKVNEVLAGFPPGTSVELTALCWLCPLPPRLREQLALQGRLLQLSLRPGPCRARTPPLPRASPAIAVGSRIAKSPDASSLGSAGRKGDRAAMTPSH